MISRLSQEQFKNQEKFDFKIQESRIKNNQDQDSRIKKRLNQDKY